MSWWHKKLDLETEDQAFSRHVPGDSHQQTPWPLLVQFLAHLFGQWDVTANVVS